MRSSVEPNYEEPRMGDTGTFRATTPELGGFLLQDGTPHQSQPLPSAPQQIHDSAGYNDVDYRRKLLLIVAIVIAVSAIVAAAVLTLLYVREPHLDQSATALLIGLQESA